MESEKKHIFLSKPHTLRGLIVTTPTRMGENGNRSKKKKLDEDLGQPEEITDS